MAKLTESAAMAGTKKKGACGVSVRVSRKTQHAPCFRCCE